VAPVPFTPAALAAACLGAVLAACAPAPAQGPVPAPPHHVAGGFANPGFEEPRRLGDLLRWRLEAWRRDVPGPEAYDFPLAPNDPAFLRDNRTVPTVTWIGHATLLVQVAGRNVLTDPHFTSRASPVAWAGPKRVVPPGLSLDDLPPIHLVVISHDHFDSLDEGSIRLLAGREGGAETVFAVPLGLGRYVREWGAARVVELDWWQAAEIDGLTVTAVPVRHWSKRHLIGRNRTLWAGFAVTAPGFRFLFCGDSGYFDGFAEIGRRLGPFDLAAIPIGAYAPRWFMGPYHMNPEEAVRVHADVRAARSVAMHWGTFVLTDEPLDEPPRRLAAAREKAGLKEDAFRALAHGETWVLAGGAGRGA
jgi:N-acyl-phosphatidylethanolamine-hydrolysing phospholipase D